MQQQTPARGARGLRRAGQGLTATGLVGSLYPLRVQDVTLRGKRALGVQVTATIVKCAGAVTRHAVAVKARVAGTVRAIRVLLRRLAVSTVVAAAWSEKRVATRANEY